MGVVSKEISLFQIQGYENASRSHCAKKLIICQSFSPNHRLYCLQTYVGVVLPPPGMKSGLPTKARDSIKASTLRTPDLVPQLQPGKRSMQLHATLKHHYTVGKAGRLVFNMLSVLICKWCTVFGWQHSEESREGTIFSSLAYLWY